MKLKLLIFCLSILSIKGIAQIADGSVAPNFTATDIDGNSHTLQDYLDDGKTVILNVSATWCGPCWNYKETGALEDIYNAYGEHGSDEVVILYVEGDASTGIDQLNGIGGNTVGDWVSSTPFPIIDNATIANQYQITYFPTVYRICPDGFVFEMGQLPTNGIVNHINTNCAGTLQGVDNHASLNVEDVVLCDDGVSADVNVSLTNYGNNTLTSLNYNVEVGSSVNSYSQSINVAQFSESSFTVNTVLDSSVDNVFEITSLNGNSPFNKY